jgi:GNAT superfamily N-acetyltransferase
MTTSTEPVHLLEAQIPAAAAVLARAFFDDPLSVYLLPDEAHRWAALPALFAHGVRYGHRFGEVFTTPGAIEGTAVWLPPASGDMSVAQAAASDIGEVAEQFGEAAMARHGTFMAFTAGLLQRDMPVPHWHLMILGVDPPHQGQGVGGRLVAPVLERADAAGVPCYLETMKARNLPFYQQHGFKVVVETDAPEGGPHLWTMCRWPRG